MAISAEKIRAFRQNFNMTTTEAAAVVYTTRRTWEYWESGKRAMPLALFELFLYKLKGDCPLTTDEDRGELVVILSDNEFQSPIDVVCRGNFLDCVQISEDIAEVSSLVTDIESKKPRVFRTKFRMSANEHFLKIIPKWKEELIDK